MSFQVTPESLLALLGVIVSLVFSYFPILRVKFAALTPEAKSGIMILTLLIVASAVFGLGCAGLLVIGLACTQDGVWHMLIALAFALATNQGTWMSTKNLLPGDVRDVRAN